MGFLANSFAASKGMGKTEVPPYTLGAYEQAKGSHPNWSGPAGGQQWNYDKNGAVTGMEVLSPYQNTFDALNPAMELAASLDPSQARDQAVNQNLDFGMSRLDPLLTQQTNAFSQQMANQGIDPGMESYDNANRALGVKQSDMFSNMFTNALNQGNETQRTQILQQMVPFQQLSSLTNSTYAHPWMGQAPEILKAMGMSYDAQKNNNAVDQQNFQNAVNSWGSIPGMIGGKGGKGGGGGGGATNITVPQMVPDNWDGKG